MSASYLASELKSKRQGACGKPARTKTCGLVRDWERCEIIVDALGQVRTAACARILFAELRRVESSSTTRRYLNAVIERLAAMPPELVDDGFDALAHDPSFSYRMRSKFKEALSRGRDFPTDWR